MTATHHNGYSWKTTEDGKTELQWNPIPNVYSPPVLHMGINYGFFYLYPEHMPVIGRIIGLNGIHFKNISTISGCLYIYTKNNRYIEVWGTDEAIDRGFCMLQRHIDRVLSNYYGVHEGFDHLPVELRPIILKRQTNIIH